MNFSLRCFSLTLAFTYTFSDDDDEEMADDDDELRASSSLGNPAGVSQIARSSKSSDDFMEEYSEALQRELQGSSLAKSFETPEIKDGPAKVIKAALVYLFVVMSSFLPYLALGRISNQKCVKLMGKCELVEIHSYQPFYSHELTTSHLSTSLHVNRIL